jgi:hypothetical protein
MSYDKDLRRARATCIVLALMNSATAVLCVRKQNWLSAVVSGLWVLCIGLLLMFVKVQQRTRDEFRRVEAGFHFALEREDERRPR